MEDREESYVIAPKGIATLAMLECGLVENINDPRINGFWRVFEQTMKECGYIVDNDEQEENS